MFSLGLAEAQEDKRKCQVCFVLGLERARWHLCLILLAKVSHMAESKIMGQGNICDLYRKDS